MVRSILLSVSALGISWAFLGCEVPYQEIGEGGGHSTSPLGNDQFEVTYRSNTSGEPSVRMQELVLLRAAEVALEYGYTHFVVEQEMQDVHTKWKTTPTMSRITGPTTTGPGISIGGSAAGIGGGSRGVGIGGSSGAAAPATPVPVAIPELTLKIRCYRGVPTTTTNGDLYDAARLRDILGIKYGIDVRSGGPPPSRQPPEIQVIE